MVKNRKAAITDERGLSVVLSHTLKSAIEFLKNNKIRAIEDIAGTQEKLGRDTYYVALIVFKTNKQDGPKKKKKLKVWDLTPNAATKKNRADG